MSAAAYYCDPKWHDFRDIKADYLVRAITDTTEVFDLSSSWKDATTEWNETGMFACCAEHLERATKWMLDKYGNVRVREIQR